MSQVPNGIGSPCLCVGGLLHIHCPWHLSRRLHTHPIRCATAQGFLSPRLHSVLFPSFLWLCAFLLPPIVSAWWPFELFFHRAVTCPQLELPHLGEALRACPWKSPKYTVLTQDRLQESLVSRDLSRKFRKCLNLLVLVLGFAGRVLKKVGVGVLRGNRCESLALYFSFAFAKGEGPVGGEGREKQLGAHSHPQACPWGLEVCTAVSSTLRRV